MQTPSPQWTLESGSLGDTWNGREEAANSGPVLLGLLGHNLHLTGPGKSVYEGSGSPCSCCFPISHSQRLPEERPHYSQDNDLLDTHAALNPSWWWRITFAGLMASHLRDTTSSAEWPEAQLPLGRVWTDISIWQNLRGRFPSSLWVDLAPDTSSL